MKNFFKNFRCYSFWVSFAGAIIILINALGNAFGFEIENQIVQDVILSFASVLVVLGIVTKTEDKKNEEGKIEEECSEKKIEDDEETDEKDVNK